MTEVGKARNRDLSILFKAASYSIELKLTELLNIRRRKTGEEGILSIA